MDDSSLSKNNKSNTRCPVNKLLTVKNNHTNASQNTVVFAAKLRQQDCHRDFSMELLYLIGLHDDVT